MEARSCSWVSLPWLSCDLTRSPLIGVLSWEDSSTIGLLVLLYLEFYLLPSGLTKALEERFRLTLAASLTSSFIFSALLAPLTGEASRIYPTSTPFKGFASF